MHPTLEGIKSELSQISNELQSRIPTDEPFNIAASNWSFPGITRQELKEEIDGIISFIDDKGDQVPVGDAYPRVQDYIRRLQFLRTNTIANIPGNAGVGVPTYVLTLRGLRTALENVFKHVSPTHPADSTETRKQLTRRVRALEAQLNSMEPRAGSLDAMITRIETAYEAADQLPEDLESLGEARKQVTSYVVGATDDYKKIIEVRDQAEKFKLEMAEFANEAKAVLQRCETAYSAATSVGLAAAFAERSSILSRSMWIWVSGLICALLAGSYFGSKQLHSLTNLFNNPAVAPSVVALNMVLSMLSIGAPVWFAWLSTKQIGQRFKLSEDYAFKASVSRAYEGFRRETARFDKEMEARLLSTALTRLDELPLRFVEAENHGSPWHELASSPVVKQALNMVPDFADQVKDLAKAGIGTLSALRTAKENTATSSEQPASKPTE
ncbi:hypothetical protein [Burkholderia cenocepacia]|uniref:hypothetical protein n=1 Tax=Burkholderia cenocepacia TaxID=95486 RepID=UPI0015898B80|nr:hypothetical protein [Burkholderia cenocepacia]